jgi:hypothetical protein
LSLVSSALLGPVLPVSRAFISVPDGPLDLEDSLLGEVFSLTPKIVILGSSVETEAKIFPLGSCNFSPKDG